MADTAQTVGRRKNAIARVKLGEVGEGGDRDAFGNVGSVVCEELVHQLAQRVIVFAQALDECDALARRGVTRTREDLAGTLVEVGIHGGRKRVYPVRGGIRQCNGSSGVLLDGRGNGVPLRVVGEQIVNQFQQFRVFMAVLLDVCRLFRGREGTHLVKQSACSTIGS